MNLSTFAKELEFVSKACEKKTTIPILANVMLDQNKGVMTLTGTDLEVACITGFPDADRKLKLRTTVATKQFQKVLKSLNGGTEFGLAKKGDCVMVSAGSFEVALPGMSAESFPEIPVPAGDPLEISGATLKAMFGFVEHSISLEESRFTLNGALFDLSSTGLRVVATDGHRLSVITAPTITGVGHMIWRTRLLRLMWELGNDVLAIHSNADHVWLTDRRDKAMRVVMARQLTGSFPDYERVMPKDDPKLTATVKREPLLKMVSRMKGLADERSCAGRMRAVSTLGTSALELSTAVSDGPSAKDSISAAISAMGTIEIGLNLEYVEQALKAFDCEQVEIDLYDPTRAIKVRGKVGELDATDVIMPMRL